MQSRSNDGKNGTQTSKEYSPLPKPVFLPWKWQQAGGRESAYGQMADQSGSSLKPDRLFINGEDKATGFAENLMTGAGGMDAEGAGRERAVFIPLAARENENVLVAVMVVPWDAARFVVTEQGGGRSCQAVAVEAVDVHPFAERLPDQLIRIFCKAEQMG